jgi:hypothetical protein
MLLNARVSYLGNSSYTSTKTNKTYYKSTFVDSNGSQLELETSSALILPQFQKVDVIVDIAQGKFPRFILVTFDNVK